MIHIRRISTEDPLYQKERELRNKVLLRPIGLPDHAWEMQDGNAWHFVAIEEGKVVGCVVLAPSASEGRRAQLMQMAVEEGQQGKGIGRMLVLELLGFCQSEGIGEVTCHARESAAGFYTSLGFETYGEPFREVGIPHFHMRRIVR